MNIPQEIEIAEKRIRPHILTTPLMESRELSKLIEGQVFLKLENEQHTGSFKARGSLNKILSLTNEERARGVITASTGNHALGFARALEIADMTGTVYLPENASQAKVEALKNYNVKLEFYGRNSLDAEIYARNMAEEKGKVWVSPYNDTQVIAGQGTIGIELLKQCERFDDVLITVGGGGLISGIGSYLKAQAPDTNIIACMPENAPEMALSLEAGKIISLPEPIDTLSDGSAGGLEEGSLTFPICQEVVDQSILVTEDQIRNSIQYAAKYHHKIIEGAAGVALASLLSQAERFKNRTVIIIICGGNISLEKFKTLI